jgi:hypothetical protein
MKLTVLVAVFYSLSMFTSTHAAETLGKIIGQLGMAEGEVFVDQKLVKKNSPLREGAVVEVKKGKATLLLGTGSVFHLAANSKMVVKQFGMRSDSNKEGGDVKLQFGRTRALILNKGSETKDVRIVTQTATMGVRGTEVYVDATNPAKAQFFTLEGLAHVEIPNAPKVEVKQNTGMSVSGGPNAGGGAAPAAGAATLTVSEVKSAIVEGGMQVANIATPSDMRRSQNEFPFDPSPATPQLRLDPIVDRLTNLTLIPTFCNAVGGGTCP